VSLVMDAVKTYLLHGAYLIASITFVLGLRDLSSPRTARRGMFLAEFGMLAAIVGTLLHQDILTYQWIFVGLAIGSVIGVPMGYWIPMTAVPQRTALSHAFGAFAVALVGVAHFYEAYGLGGHALSGFERFALGFEVLLGSLTFTGSLIAAAKLHGMLPGAPITYRGQNIVTAALIAVLLVMWIWVVVSPEQVAMFFVLTGLALVFGVALVLPIGAADMPVVIAILNSYGGLAASATGFALSNNVLIIAGALDGGSGFLLSILMCKAMNRSWGNVLFGAFGKVQEASAVKTVEKPVKAMDSEEAGMLLDMAEHVVIVPGYGMAVSQAQYAVKELTDLLEKRQIDVKFAIHPVAGRMPGHMNVLLAEAGIDYDKLFDMDQINNQFPQTDVAIVIGANDVVNPAAYDDPKSPIYGMPILDVHLARSVLVLKRSMAPGFAGIENELFYRDNTSMVFGDAKKSVEGFIRQLKEMD
jgi:NAD(P) transhydrogenase subunit beta